jgi:hypothetical protein
MTTAQDGGKVVSPMHWPPLPPGTVKNYAKKYSAGDIRDYFIFITNI